MGIQQSCCKKKKSILKKVYSLIYYVGSAEQGVESASVARQYKHKNINEIHFNKSIQSCYFYLITGTTKQGLHSEGVVQQNEYNL